MFWIGDLTWKLKLNYKYQSTNIMQIATWLAFMGLFATTKFEPFKDNCVYQYLVSTLYSNKTFIGLLAL